ncbi:MULTISPECIES: 3-keto-5-aminohexanoate cleavage protein [Rhizobium]|uniref:3-keto-5-aminohexanoate cleavage protein n=1 Tax=Rhizobium lentis TaxID=1138194 RepID=A0ABS7I9D2_9HYPH|nr:MULTISPECIES: 3-keto-5-aminohexanoate cleavage protein [Rhizobium]MBX4922332.1 3-keto-5-aminohexanoate cleavage protein [Rhizobium bangladeshense]MBX5041202.1 3-keto-5-aminohexanoate cleavage protein [Rhizobium lentis]MBX5051901.1 3-keto-5-aminohexanoate cleavage protein [Rhizobium lentis]MBX5071459.1 3-keto-5-aminohexanoate cleavage protein [Rhizobium lentis]MBX5088433.1 3-keto-5-aminohexanoate cleavage protein [Rhizobium lentis]
MKSDVIITCAVTGNLTTRENHPGLPVTPQEIADSCLEAAAAGAAIAHIHVRDPGTGKPSMELKYYEEVIRRIREKDSALILNVTTGPGGRYHPSDENPAIAGPRTTLMRPEKRVEHIVALKPDIATLDLNTMTFGSEVVINTPQSVKTMADIIYSAGSKPELEVFDTGHIQLALDMLKDGTLRAPTMFTIVTGVKYGFPASPEVMAMATRLLPPDAVWSAFGVGRMSFPMAMQAYLLGGHVRVGLEDNSYISKGVLAKGNGELVERARDLIEKLGGKIASANQAREILGLKA